MIFVEETDNRFYIKESTIPNAGFGCFAKEKIKKSDYLEIIGIKVKYGSLIDLCTKYAKNYKFSAEGNFEECIIPMGYGGMVNHTDDQDLQNVAITYLPPDVPVRNQHAGRAVYMAIRDIEENEELLGKYNRKTMQL